MGAKPGQRVAVIGVGIMGSAIARRLLECGHAVCVFDLDAAKVATLQQQGALAAGTAAAAASASDFVITSLNSAAVLERALFGEAGVAAAAPADPRRLLIDMSSIDPASTRRLAQLLHERTGMGFVDAPLSGGAPKALLGQLTVMAGGSEHDVARARAVMDSLCANYTRMGESGAGQTTKVVNQLLCAIGFQAVAEAVRLAASMRPSCTPRWPVAGPTARSCASSAPRWPRATSRPPAASTTCSRTSRPCRPLHRANACRCRWRARSPSFTAPSSRPGSGQKTRPP